MAMIDRWMKWRDALWPIILYLVLAIIFTWPLITHITEALPGVGTDPLFQTWVLAWNAHALTTDPARIWDAPIFYPYPGALAYSDHHIALALMVFPVLLAGKPVVAYNLLILLSFTLSGWGLFLLVRELLRERFDRRSLTAGAIVAGALFAFSTYRSAHLGHLQLLQTMWLPITLYWMYRLLRGADRPFWLAAVFTGVFAGLQIISAVYYAPMTILSLIIAACVWMVPPLTRWPERSVWHSIGKRGAGLVLAAVVAVAIATPVMLPYVAVYRYLDISRSPLELTRWSAPLQSYLAVTPHNLFYSRFDSRIVTVSVAGEFTLFPGFLAFALFIAGLICLIRRRLWHILFAFVGIGVTGFILSLGLILRLTFDGEPIMADLPYRLLYAHVPGFNALRVPARWWMIGSLALATLAGIGVAMLWQRRSWRWLAGTIAIAAVIEHIAVPVPLIAVSPPAPVYTWLGRTNPDAQRAVLELPVAEEIYARGMDQIIMRRQYNQMYHWRPLVAGYSGLIPYGAIQLFKRVQQLPDDGTVQYLAQLGVDTLIIHRDEFVDRPALARWLHWADHSPLLEKRVDVGNSIVYAIKPDPFLQSLDPGNTQIWFSDDPAIDGLLALALQRRWKAAGATIYGAGRSRYYPEQMAPTTGQRFTHLLLSEHGATSLLPADLIWKGRGAALYQVSPDYIMTQPLGAPDVGQYHPRHPSVVTATLHGDSLQIDDHRLLLPQRMDQVVLVFAVASLNTQEIRIGADARTVPAGSSIVTVTLRRGEPLTIRGDEATFAIVQAQLWRHAPKMAPIDQPALAVTGQFEQSQLALGLRVLGEARIALDIRGVEAGTGRHFYLAAGTVSVAQNGAPTVIGLDVLNPTAPWLERAQPALDGRYIAYLKVAWAQTSREVPVARFSVREGKVIDAQPAPVPLTVVQ